MLQKHTQCRNSQCCWCLKYECCNGPHLSFLSALETLDYSKTALPIEWSACALSEGIGREVLICFVFGHLKLVSCTDGCLEMSKCLHWSNWSVILCWSQAWTDKAINNSRLSWSSTNIKFYRSTEHLQMVEFKGWKLFKIESYFHSLGA